MRELLGSPAGERGRRAPAPQDCISAPPTLSPGPRGSKTSAREFVDQGGRELGEGGEASMMPSSPLQASKPEAETARHLHQDQLAVLVLNCPEL